MKKYLFRNAKFCTTATQAKQYPVLKVIELAAGFPLITDKNGQNPNPHVWVSLAGAIHEVRNLDEAMENLAGKAITFGRVLNDGPVRLAFFADPDGIRLEIVALRHMRRLVRDHWDELTEFEDPVTKAGLLKS